MGVLDALGWLAADPRRLEELVHLWRRSRLAAARLAAALMVLLPLLETSENLHLKRGRGSHWMSLSRPDLKLPTYSFSRLHTARISGEPLFW